MNNKTELQAAINHALGEMQINWEGNLFSDGDDLDLAHEIIESHIAPLLRSHAASAGEGAEVMANQPRELIAKRIVESANREICRANAPSLTAWPLFHDEVYVRIIAAELRQQNAALVSALRDALDKCRSSMSIAQRDGRDVNWLAWRNQLNASIFRQAEALAHYAPAEAEAKEKP